MIRVGLIGCGASAGRWRGRSCAARPGRTRWRECWRAPRATLDGFPVTADAAAFLAEPHDLIIEAGGPEAFRALVPAALECSDVWAVSPIPLADPALRARDPPHLGDDRTRAAHRPGRLRRVRRHRRGDGGRPRTPRRVRRPRRRRRARSASCSSRAPPARWRSASRRASTSRSLPRWPGRASTPRTCASCGRRADRGPHHGIHRALPRRRLRGDVEAARRPRGGHSRRRGQPDRDAARNDGGDRPAPRPDRGPPPRRVRRSLLPWSVQERPRNALRVDRAGRERPGHAARLRACAPSSASSSPRIEGEFRWDRASLSGVAALSILLSGALSPFTGWLADRWGPRRVIIVACAILGVGCLWASQVGALWQMYASGRSPPGHWRCRRRHARRPPPWPPAGSSPGAGSSSGSSARPRRPASSS